MKRQRLSLFCIFLLAAAAGGMLFFSRGDDGVSLDSVLEVWEDVVRDVDQIGLTITRASMRQEAEAGLMIEQEIARQWHLRDDPTLQAYLTGVGQALTDHTQRKGIRYRFYVVDTPMINAYAIAGGGIYITTGMLAFLESEAELAAILGHEISHVDLRHSIERLQYELAARKIGGAELGAVARLGYTLVALGFSEQQELEADSGGAFLSAKAGYDPLAAKANFERLSKFEKERGGERREGPTKPNMMLEEFGSALAKTLEQYFATHPPTDTRIRELTRVFERNARGWRGQRFYVGKSNYRDRIPRARDERPSEWRSP